MIYCFMVMKEKEDVFCFGEEGIDSGVLVREFFVDNILEIGKILFFGGVLVDFIFYV